MLTYFQFDTFSIQKEKTNSIFSMISQKIFYLIDKVKSIWSNDKRIIYLICFFETPIEKPVKLLYLQKKIKIFAEG